MLNLALITLLVYVFVQKYQVAPPIFFKSQFSSIFSNIDAIWSILLNLLKRLRIFHQNVH